MARALTLGRDVHGQVLRLTPEQRSRHLHVLGASGRGKTRFLESLIRQDIRQGHGLCLIDPHGTLYENLLKWCARYGVGRHRRIHLINPNDQTWTVGLNPLRCDDPTKLAYVVDGLVDACAQVWGGEDSNRTPRLKRCLRAVFYALAEQKLTLADAVRLTRTADYDGFRAALVGVLDDPIYQAVWDDLSRLSPNDFTVIFDSTNNRLLEFLGSPTLRQMFSVTDGALDLRQCMDEGHVVLVNLQPTLISRANARVVGTMITNALFANAVQRDAKTSRQHPFYLYLDESYRFLTDDIESMLDETRKYGLHVALICQRLTQLDRYGEHIRNAVLTNAQTKVVFGGLADEDAEPLAKEILRETFDFNRPKIALDKPVVTGYQTIWLRNRSQSSSETTATGTSQATGQSAGTVAGETIGQMFDEQGNQIGVARLGASESATEVASESEGAFSSTGRSYTESAGESEALLPILEMMHTAMEGEAEILHRAILQLRQLPPRHYIYVQPGQPPTIVRVPDVEDPRVLSTQVPRFVTAMNEKSPFVSPAVKDVADLVVDDDPDDDESLFRYRPDP